MICPDRFGQIQDLAFDGRNKRSNSDAIALRNSIGICAMRTCRSRLVSIEQRQYESRHIKTVQFAIAVCVAALQTARMGIEQGGNE